MKSIMEVIKWIVNLIVAAICVVFQQAFVIFLGVLVYDATSLAWGILIWLLCVPMLWLNYYTIQYIFKYGIINFMTMNADTSEIDVDKQNRWYNTEK